VGGGYFGGIYFGQYAPLVAAPVPPAPAAAPAVRIVAEPWPGRARKTALRRGWRWHRARYEVLQGARLLGSAFKFADALELALARGGDLIRRVSPDNPLRELRRWYGAELEAALAKFRRRLP
jgi:hypothetical protein